MVNDLQGLLGNLVPLGGGTGSNGVYCIRASKRPPGQIHPHTDDPSSLQSGFKVAAMLLDVALAVSHRNREIVLQPAED